MTEAEAREIVRAYEALVVAAARTPRDTLQSNEQLLGDHRLTLRDGRLELQAIRMFMDYDVVAHSFEPTLWSEDFEARIERCTLR